jgi:AraC-like DNA-binding protein/mannose-6-phosphate isomerase-like protein (cupin superfamily)
MGTKKQDTIRFLSLPDLSYVQCAYGTNVTNEFSRHVHNRFSIGIILKGERVITRNSTESIIPENGVFVINPGESHTCNSRYEKHSYFTICVDTENINAIASQMSERTEVLPYFTNILLHDADLSLKIRQFISLAENTSSTLERESVLISLLSTLILRYGDKPPILCRTGSHAAAINNACDFMEAHYAEKMSLKQLSHVARLSPFYFQRLFLKNKGISPHEYLVHFRIKIARKFLDEGQNIVGIAFDTGFVDQSYFNRSFKSVVGITPGLYLQSRDIHHCEKVSKPN